MNSPQMSEDNDNSEDELIRSNFQKVEETSLLTSNDSDNPLMKQLNRLLALKNLHQLDSRLNKTKEAEDQLLKREERKIVNRLQKENLEIADLSGRIQKKSKLSVGFDIPPKDVSSCDTSDYEVSKHSKDDDKGEANSDNDNGSEKGSWSEYARDLCNPRNLEKDTNPNEQCSSGPSAFERVSPDSKRMYENTLTSEIGELQEIRKSNYGDGTENGTVYLNPKLKNENGGFDKTQKPIIKRPFLKKGAGLSRFFGKATQKTSEAKTKSGALPNAKQTVFPEIFEHSSLDSDNLSSSTDIDDELVENFAGPVHSFPEKLAATSRLVPSSRTSETAGQPPLKASKPIGVPFNIFGHKPSTLTLKIADAAIPQSSQIENAAETSSLSSFTDSDCERDPELNLFELMETMSTQPGFSKFSELAKKFVTQEYVNQDVAQELKNVNKKLMDDKKSLESVHQNLMRDKISLLKIIEDLRPDVEALRQEKEKIQRKMVLDVRLERETLEQEKQKWLKEKEMLLKSTNALRNEQKALTSESKSLEEENQRLAKEKLQLLKEKEDWNNEKNEILSTKQDLIAEQHKLLKEKELLSEIKTKNRKSVSAETSPKTSEARSATGEVVVTLENGTTKYTSKDGCDFKYVYQNGDVKELRPDGTIEYFYRKSNIWHTTHPDGTIVMKFSNGQVETVDPDGTKTVVYPNEIVRKIRPNGTEEYIYPDDTVAVSEVNGVKCITFTNGEKEFHYEHFTKRVYPDGTVKTLFEDGSSETKWVNGRVRAKGSAGILIYDSGEPSRPEFLQDMRSYKNPYKKT